MTQEPYDQKTLPTSSEELLNTLKYLKINGKIYNHDPIFTVEEGVHLKAEIPGMHCRNLFLKDKKGKMFLITAANETQIDLKALQQKLDCGRLSFGKKEILYQYLGIYPGAVNPFCAINDKDNAVQILLDQKMMNADSICVHPMDNAMTIAIKPSDLLDFFVYTGHKAEILEF